MLRGLNDPLAENVLLPLLPPIILPGTQLALKSTSGTGVEQTFINTLYTLALGSFPALGIFSGKQQYSKNSTSTYAGWMETEFDLYDLWYSQPTTLASVRANLALDVRRMKANLLAYFKNNNGLLVGSTIYPLSIRSATISGYLPGLVKDFPNVAVGFRRLTVRWNKLPYQV